MEEEFNLSEKMTSGDRYRFWYHEKDIKEFIRLLKDKLFGDAIKPTDNEAIEIIDKLAGDDLIDCKEVKEER